MMKHTRMYCNECRREWLVPTKYFTNSAPLTITGNRRDDLCIYCGSGSIELVEYQPSFLGGDIPRPDSPSLVLSPLNTGDDYDPSKVKEVTPGFAVNNLIKMTGGL